MFFEVFFAIQITKKRDRSCSKCLILYIVNIQHITNKSQRLHFYYFQIRTNNQNKDYLKKPLQDLGITSLTLQQSTSAVQQFDDNITATIVRDIRFLHRQ